MLDTAGFVCGHLAAFALIWSSCLAAGTSFLRRGMFRDGLEAAAVRTGFGFGVLGILLFLVGLFGALRPGVVVALLVLVHVAGAGSLFRDGIRSMPLPDLRARMVLAVFALSLLPAFVLALYPPTAFDATLYHLPYARLFAEQNAVVFADTLRFPVFPQLNEMLFTGTFLLYDDVTAHLVQLLAFAVTGLALASWAGGVTGSVGGPLATAMWMGSPLAVYLAGSAYIDLGVAMFVTLAFLALQRWRETASGAWILLSGAFIGMAAGSKYHGVLIAALMVIALLLFARDRRLRTILLFASAAIICAAPFYVRNEMVTGNPLFPYLHWVFGGLRWLTVGERRILDGEGTPMEIGLTILRKTVASSDFATFPWRTAFDRVAMHGMPPTSILMPLLVPAAIIGAVRSQSVRMPLLVALGFMAASASLDPRFAIIVLPLFIYGAAVWVSSVVSTPRLAGCIAVLALLPGPGYGAYKVIRQGAVPVTAEDRRAYLLERVAPYEALDYLNAQCGADHSVYALQQESAAYHSEGRFLGDHLGPWRFSLVEAKLDDAAALAQVLRGMKADYFLLDRGHAEVLEGDDRFRQLFPMAWRSRAFAIYRVPGGRDCSAPDIGGTP